MFPSCLLTANDSVCVCVCVCWGEEFPLKSAYDYDSFI